MKLIMIKKIITNPLFQLAILMMFLPLCLSVMEKTWKIYGSDAYFNKESFVFDNGTGFIEKEIEETGCENSSGETTTTWMLQAIQNLKLVDGTDIADLAAGSTDYLSEIWTGAIMPFAGPAGPGWLICDGAEYEVGPETNCRYRKLFEKLGTSLPNPLWGTTITGVSFATYSGTLKVPDLRGYFLRGSDIATLNVTEALESGHPLLLDRDTSSTERHKDPDFNSGVTYGHKQKTAGGNQSTADYPVGTYQGYTYKTHTDHSLTMPELLINNSDVIHTHTFGANTVTSLENIWEDDNVNAGKTGTSSIANLVSVSGGDTTSATASSHSHTIPLNLTVDAATEDTETRPKNVAVYFYIKY